MTRIATGAVQQSALADIMRAQRELATAHKQYSSGKVAADLKGFGAQAETLVATRAVLARETAYVDAARKMEAKLDAQALAVGAISDIAAELRTALTEALGLDDGRTLLTQMEGMAARAAMALNTEFGGEYLFDGGRAGVAPFAAASLNDLAAAATLDDLFDNGTLRAGVRLDDGAPVRAGLLADELGGELVASLKRIRDFADANGGFSDPLTEVERNFLTGEIAAAKAAFETVSMLETQTGLAQNRAETARRSATERGDALEMMLSGMEDMDMAQATVRLQQAQIALQASAQAFTVLNGASLLNYLK